MSWMTGLGSWLVMRVGRGIYAEAVAGDLAEGVRGGRSAGWYWRQVFAAVGASWANGLRVRRGRILFAAAWGACWPVHGLLGHAVMVWWLRGTVDLALGPRQVLMLAQGVLIDVTYLWVGLLVYLALDRERWREVPLGRFVRGWATCFGLFVAGKMVLLFGLFMLLMKMGLVGEGAGGYFRWQALAGEPVMAMASLLVAIAVMVPMKRGGVEARA